MIVITGATGQFGRQVVDHLLKRGVPASEIAAAVRTPANAGDLAELGIEIREADFDRPETLVPAFLDSDKLLFVSANGPNALRITQHRAVVQAAKAAGVRLLAYTSITQADRNPLRLADVHRDTEAALVSSGIPTVLLRNGWYTENYTGSLSDSAQRGMIAGSSGAGRIASATRADLAEAAAVILTLEGQAGKVYELTGDTAWSLPELAAEVSAQFGKPVVYADLPLAQYKQILVGAGLPDFLVDMIADANVNIAQGALSSVTSDLREILGRPTTPLSDAIAAARMS